MEAMKHHRYKANTECPIPFHIVLVIRRLVAAKPLLRCQKRHVSRKAPSLYGLAQDIWWQVANLVASEPLLLSAKSYSERKEDSEL